MSDLIQKLEERGLVEQCTDTEGLNEILESGQQTVYCGFDPTAESLHLGNLIPILGLKRFQDAGQKIIAVVGGATGMIGDPSGRSTERDFLDEEQLKANVESITKQLARFLTIDDKSGCVVNNLDWTKGVTLIEWMRGIGKQFTINKMVAKESVRSRFEDRDQGISYTEFSYMLLQAFDFMHLNNNEKCRIQIGGSDQWGNITAGIDLIRRNGGTQSYGLTFPLLTTASGQKFGKSLGGAIWLDKEHTNTWDFYQYFIRTDDRDAIKFIKIFTSLSMEEIARLEKEVETDPGKRTAQKRLAFEVTAFVHGEEEAKKLEKAAEAFYAGRLGEIDAEVIHQIFKDFRRQELTTQELESGVLLIDLVTSIGLVKSKGDAKRMEKQGALYVNDSRAEIGRAVTIDDLLDKSKTVILRKGKKEYGVVCLKD
jgi:tyrosyl-tRNA synthetase